MSRHSHGCGRGPCFAAGAAALLLATASSAANRERESVWYGVGLLAGATQLDPHLGDFQWDVRPRAAWGAEALAGRGRWTGGVRAWRATSTQTLGPSGTTSADVAVTTLEVLGQTRVASIAATDLLATANAGGLWLGYRPDQVTITPAGSSTPIVVDLAPVQEWVAGAGLSLRRPVAGHWSASLAVDVQLFALDAAHRNGSEIEIERESFGDWSARLGLAWLSRRP